MMLNFLQFIINDLLLSEKKKIYFQDCLIIKTQINQWRMTSPKKGLDIEKESTLFGDLTQLEKQTERLSKHLLADIQSIKKVQAEFVLIQKQGKNSSQDFKLKAATDISTFQDKIKNFLIAQKAQYTRLATQINQIVTNHKDINSQLQLLNNRFEDYQRNVGL